MPPYESALGLPEGGIKGVNLYLSCFGPALEVFSRPGLGTWHPRQELSSPGASAGRRRFSMRPTTPSPSHQKML